MMHPGLWIMIFTVIFKGGQGGKILYTDKHGKSLVYSLIVSNNV
jgi:hypothetical protein